MGNHASTLLHVVNTALLFSLLAGAQALAQDNSYPAQIPAGSALQTPSSNDCYKGDRNGRLMLRVTDIASLWHYAARILQPAPGATAATPRNDRDARGTKQRVVWRVGTEGGGVSVSANLAW